MNPHITPDNVHTATRLHHRLKNSHCYYRKTSSSVGQRATTTRWISRRCIRASAPGATAMSITSLTGDRPQTCASLRVTKNDRHHHGSHQSGVERAAHDLSIPVGQRSMMPEAQVLLGNGHRPPFIVHTVVPSKHKNI